MSSFTCDVHKTHSRTFLSLSLSLLLMLTPGPAPPAEMLAYLFLRKRDLHHSSDKPVVVLVLVFFKELADSVLPLFAQSPSLRTHFVSLSLFLSLVCLKARSFCFMFCGLARNFDDAFTPCVREWAIQFHSISPRKKVNLSSLAPSSSIFSGAEAEYDGKVTKVRGKSAAGLLGIEGLRRYGRRRV